MIDLSAIVEASVVLGRFFVAGCGVLALGLALAAWILKEKGQGP